jgi:hypothetical protein
MVTISIIPAFVYGNPNENRVLLGARCQVYLSLVFIDFNFLICIGKRPVERHRYRWEENINIGLKEIVCERADWIHLT